MRQRHLKKVFNRAKILKKEMTHETEIYGDQLEAFEIKDKNNFSKKCTDYEDDFSEDTTAVGNYQIEHLLNSMKMNPIRKTQIDSKHQDKSSENLSTEEE